MECVICWKNILCDFSDGSRISDQRHVNTSKNEMSPTDIFISNWFDVCLWSNIQCYYEMDYSFLLVLMTGFPWNMARPQLHLLLLSKSLMSSLEFHIAITQNLQYKLHPEFWPSPRRIFKTSLYYKQSGTKPNLVAKILATNFGVFFVIYVMFSKICSMCL